MAGKLADLFVNIGAKTDQFTQGLSNVKKETSQLSSVISKVGGMVAGAFAIERVVSFASEVSQLAQAAEGVEIAFKRIGGAAYLDDMRAATKGTVSDLELMKAAVQASNFKIPLEQMGSLLEFAHQRAKDTGQSVDYLVQSIILGIGRKSPLILDNLGISAIALKEKMKGVASETASVGDVAKAVGEIANEEMAKVGKSVDTTAEKTANLKSQWTNLKVELGNVVNVLIKSLAPAFAKVAGAASKAAKMFQNVFKGLFQGNWIDPDVVEKGVNEVVDKVKKQSGDLTSNAKNRIDQLREGVAYMQRAMVGASIKQKAVLQNQIEIYKQAISALKNLMPTEDLESSFRTLKKIEDEIAEQQTKLREATDVNNIKELTSIDRVIKKLEKEKETILNLIALRNREKNEIPKLLTGKTYKDISVTASKDVLDKTKRPKYTSLQNDSETNIFGAVNGKLPTSDVEGFSAAWEKAGGTILNVTQTLSEGITNFVVDFSDAIGGLIAGTASWGDVGQAVLKNVGSFMTSLGKQLIALGTAKIVTDTVLAMPGGGGAAIAMGAALVAMGGAINSSFSKSPMSGGSSRGVSRSAYSGMGNNNSTIEVIGVTRGEDIYWSQKRTEQRLNNTSPRTR